MKTFYFTFGSNHLDREGRSLHNYYCAVVAADRIEAVNKMTVARSNSWSNYYLSKKDAGIEEYNLIPISLKNITLYGKHS